MRKPISLVLAATLLLGSAPAWAAERAAAGAPAGSRPVRDSVDGAVRRAVEGSSVAWSAPATPAPRTAAALTAEERNDLAARRDALQTDPVARGAGQAVMILLGAAASIGGSIYLIHELNKNKTTAEAAASRR